MKKRTSCPLCDNPYDEKKHHITHHHIFPKVLYGAGGLKVEACHECHQVEFNYIYPVRDNWSPETCILNWIKFCKSKGKNALVIYPELGKFFT